MRVGSLVYATDQGLGILAKSFHDAGVVTDVMVVRHGKHTTHEEWYPGAGVISSFDAQRVEIVKFMQSMDVMLFFETPFRWDYIDVCKTVNTKTTLMVMHECLHNRVHQNIPDLFLCPSLLDYEAVKDIRPSKIVTMPVPVQVPWRLRTKAEVFVHRAGHGGLMGRNGTKELLEAMQFVKSPVTLKVYSQKPFDTDVPGDNRVWLETTTKQLRWEDIWCNGGEGDVFIFPEKFNGLSLPLQEARAAGMLVMCGDRFPMNTWLPTEPLIPVKEYKHNQRVGPPYTPFDEAVFDPQVIAATIDNWFGRGITDFSLGGREWAAQNSWEKLRPGYQRVLKNLCGQSG
jgi:hypothetical protein